MTILTYIAFIWGTILIIGALLIKLKNHIEKKYYDKLKRNFENAWCDEQLLDIVYNTFQLKQKRK